MKAKVTVTKLELRNVRLIQSPGQIGHSFEFVTRLKVEPRTMGLFSGEGIDWPKLQWFETIDWYKLDLETETWIYVGSEPRHKDLYAENPLSQTFITWREGYRYTFARNTRGFPVTLINAPEAEVKHWIARNGFEWELPIKDIPSISLQGGSRGGAGVSLVIGPTRRRVVRFNLGFAGNPHRIHCTQILETVEGQPTINVFIPKELNNIDLNDQDKLVLWSNSVNF